MPIPIADALDLHAVSAEAKIRALTTPLQYLAASVLAGVFVGMAVVLQASVAGPLAAEGSPLARPAGAAVFGVALTLVVFAGGELFTGNVMTTLQALAVGRLRGSRMLLVWLASLAGNAAGALGLAALVHGGGSLVANGGLAFVEGAIEAKASAAGGELFARAVLGNMLVCLALWMAVRATSDAARLVVLWWGLVAFVAPGFEHSVANAAAFGLAVLAGDAGWSDLWRNLAWTVPGNVVGGAVIGLAFAWIGRPAGVPSHPAGSLAPDVYRDLSVGLNAAETPA